MFYFTGTNASAQQLGQLLSGVVNDSWNCSISAELHEWKEQKSETCKCLVSKG